MSNELREAIKSSKFFYRDHYRRMCSGLLTIFFLLLVLVVALFYAYAQRPLPTFYASSSDGSLVQLTPLSSPNYSSTPLIE